MSTRNYELKEENKGYPVYSFSKLSTFKHCKYAYYLQYILKQRSRQNIYGATGESAHNAAQDLVKHKINNNNAYERFLSELDDTLEILGLNFPTPKSGQTYRECVGDFILRYKPNHDKYDIERGFDVKIGNSNAIMMGFIDLIYWNEDGTIDVVDYKTSSQFSKKDFEDKKMQLLAYVYALQKEGFKVNRVYFNMLKYCNIEWDEINSKKQLVHKSMKSERNDICNKLKATTKRLLKKEGVDELEIDIRLENMLKNNQIDESIKDRFSFTDYCVDVPCTDEDIQEFSQWFENTVKEIDLLTKDLDKKNPSDTNFPCVKIDKGSEFFCNLLCGHNCKYFTEYKEGNKNSYKNRHKINNIDDEIEDLL